MSLPLLKAGDDGDAVRRVRRRLGVFPIHGGYDEALTARVRGMQMIFGLPVTGELTAEDAKAMGLGDIVREGTGA